VKLLKLFKMGSRWYASVQDGNFTMGGFFGAPTMFPATMSREAVLAAMQRATPELDVSAVKL